jgi:hypothetical protein
MDKNKQRCIIVDPEGQELLPGIVIKTPEVSKPHIGKTGTWEIVGEDVKITLYDGTILWGYECWWDSL